MWRIFSIFSSWILLSLAAPWVLAVSTYNLLPAEVFSKSRITLENREVKEKQGFLFTRVDLKPKPGVFGSILESQASLFALRNFAAHNSSTFVWDQLQSKQEQAIALALYQRVTRKHAIVNGLTPIKKTANSETLSFIFSSNAPADGGGRTYEIEIVARIKDTLQKNPERIDFLGYLELAMRQPKVFDPIPAVKGLKNSFGDEFLSFLFGLDLANPEFFNGHEMVASIELSSKDRDEIALLLGKMPYHPVLALRFAEILLADSFEEVAKLAIAGSCRLSKVGPLYERAVNLAQKLKIDLSGVYIHPVPSIFSKRVADEFTRAGITLPPCYIAILKSLGDLPLIPESGGVAVLGESVIESEIPQIEIGPDLYILNRSSCRNPGQLKIAGSVFYDKGFPNLALCFLNQAAIFDPSDLGLRRRLRSLTTELGLEQYIRNFDYSKS